MTRKDYVLIAGILHGARKVAEYKGDVVTETVEGIASAFCDVLKSENSEFDRAKFLRYVREGK